MHRRSSGKVPKVEEGISDSEEGLQVKVQSLEKTLNTFRAEVDMKMKIMEQILTTRNEQFAVQKKLLEREHALYQTVLGHWRNTGELAAKGLSLHFSQDVDTLNDDEMDPDEDDLLGSKTSSTAARRARRKRLRAKRLRTELQQPKKLCGDDVDVQLIFSEDEDQRMEVDVKGCGGSDDDYDPSGDGLERKVFVNYYAEEGGKRGEKSSNPVWSYFLREETGKSALCKLCDDGGVQKIIKTHDSSTSPLRRHLKIKHKIECGGGPVSEPRSVASKSSRMSTPGDGTKRGSPVWQYFTKFKELDIQKARCNVCDENGKETIIRVYDGSTSRLHIHLKAHHDIDAKTMSFANPTPLKLEQRRNSEGKELDAIDTSVLKGESVVEANLDDDAWNTDNIIL